MTHRVLSLLSGLTLLLSLPLCAAGTSGWVTVTPGATDDILTNPGIGVASFHDGYGEHLGLAQYPDAGYEYFRFYWRQLEPQEGQFNFAPIDRVFALAAAHRPAMNVALRIMALDAPESGSMVPDWLIQKGINGSWSANGQTFIPDLSDPRFIRYAQRLMNALGQRYDGNPALAFIDIGLVGSWGEWHNSNFQSQTPPAAALHYRPAEPLCRHALLRLSQDPESDADNRRCLAALRRTARCRMAGRLLGRLA